MDDYNSYVANLKNNETAVDFDKMLLKIEHKSVIVPRQRMALAAALMLFIFGFATYFIQMQAGVDNDLMTYAFSSQQSIDELMDSYLF